MAVFPSATDIAIVGGGPAGAAAALTLRRYTGHACLLIDAGDYSAVRVGETVSPALPALLDYLGAGDALAGGACLAGDGPVAAWGQAGLIAAPGPADPGGSLMLDRQRFDRALASAAERAGARLALRTRLRGAEVAARGGWTLRLEQDGGDFTVRARQVVEASGRKAVFARRTGAVVVAEDRLIAYAACYRLAPGGEGSPRLLIEAVREGWWYAAPIPGSRQMVAYLTDADLAAHGAVDQVYLAALARTRHIAARLAGAERLGPPLGHPAGSQSLQPCLGQDWVAAGDAARSFDPLSSLGIGHALASGIQAARIVADRAAGGETLAAAYPADIARIGREHETRRRLLYAAERRWPESRFWRRRAVAAAEPDRPVALADA